MSIEDGFIEFLNNELELIREQELEDSTLSNAEKVEKGILLENCSFIPADTKEGTVHLSCEINNSKFRVGDAISVTKTNGSTLAGKALLLENGEHELVIQTSSLSFFNSNDTYNIECTSFNQHQLIIDLLKRFKDNPSGRGFLKFCDVDNLDNVVTPTLTLPTLSLKPKSIDGYISNLNSTQQRILRKVLACPQFFCIQGPPGTGKSFVLAKIASIFFKKKRNILILANTHQAVNNALSRVKSVDNDANVAKIGQRLKTENLYKDIPIFTSFSQCNKNMQRDGKVIGMTLATALVQLGLRDSPFFPEVILVDEASQITLPQASILGLYKSPSIIFFGDEKQMPPIFTINNSKYSISIFEHLKNKYPTCSDVLDKTFRLNGEICKLISETFYDTPNHPNYFISANPDNKLKVPDIANIKDTLIKEIFKSDESLFYINVDTIDSKDENISEASIIAKILEECKRANIPLEEICVTTPYRRQVRQLLNQVNKIDKVKENVIIDTVERVQGIDKEIVIISMCSSDINYIMENKNFIFNKNRLNVMLSRAKTKIIICASDNVCSMGNYFTDMICKCKKIKYNPKQLTPLFLE